MAANINALIQRVSDIEDNVDYILCFFFCCGQRLFYLWMKGRRERKAFILEADKIFDGLTAYVMLVQNFNGFCGTLCSKSFVILQTPM